MPAVQECCGAVGPREGEPERESERQTGAEVRSAGGHEEERFEGAVLVRKSEKCCVSLCQIVAHRAELPANAHGNGLPASPVLSAPRIGLVGAGRSKNGLGPFLAAACEAAGARVVGVSGRNPARAVEAAEQLVGRLQHAVAAYSSARLLAQHVDALVIASPAEAHAEGLVAALATGVPCLCEKPLVPVDRTADGLALCEAFRRRGLLLAENCQWPQVLPALWQLHPGLQERPVQTVAMGLGPSQAGRAMIEDSISHVLSVVQALVPFGMDTAVAGVRQTDAGERAEQNVVTFRMVEGAREVAVELHLRRCPVQPRPAWLAVNGARIDRRIGPNYEQSFVAANESVPVSDPLHQLVYAFVAHLTPRNRERSPATVASPALHELIAVRLRCQEAIFRGLERGSREFGAGGG